MAEYVPYIVLLPLAGFLFNGFVGKRVRSETLVGIIGSGVVGGSFLLGLMIFVNMLGLPAENRSHVVSLFPWISAGSLHVEVGYQVDQLSVLMTLIVTGVGFLIHVYSIGYMRGDPGFWRFFAYMNLFIFMMLNLVLADNFLLMFLGWEGVGLCSYLLIGFWHEKQFDTGGYAPGTATTNDAAKKAFIVNRIGDFGFLIGLFLIFVTFGTLGFEEVFAQASASFAVGDPTIVWITMLLFLGATGKSAQIPLFVWLPDAMAGPTPVSALIHAATMVTAGVYMVARCSVLYALAPATMTVVAVIGASTAVFAATMGLVQNDIKKILAYSTISQLGYMFLALGVGAFSAGIFHVMTHAFFKALLFLGAGAVIHGLHDEQDIRHMGGLRNHLPVTYRTFVAASLAIAGIPPLSGFFSKDEILWKAFSEGSTIYWVVGWFTAALTAFYMFRLVVVAFEGEPRWKQGTHPHEAPSVMTVPLVILAVLSVVGGLAGIPHSLGGGNWIEQWLDPVFQSAHAKLSMASEGPAATEYALMTLSIIVAVAGIWFARLVYLKRSDIIVKLSSSMKGLYTLFLNKYYVDEVYDAVVVRPVVRGSEKLLWKTFDVGLIDAAVNGVAGLIATLSTAVRRMQVGVVQSYALVFVFGILVILGLLMFH